MLLFLLKGALIVLLAIAIIGFGIPMLVGWLEVLFGAGTRKPKKKKHKEED